MKRTFLAKRNALLLSTNFSWGVIALAFSIFALLVRLLIPNIFWQIFTPVFQSSDTLTAGVHHFLSSFEDVAALKLKNEQLVNENITLTSENRTLTVKEAALSALLGSEIANKKGSQNVLAGVVARPPTSPYDTLVIGAGSNAGVVSGQEVFAGNNVPIGIITKVFPDFSQVTLFTAPRMEVQGWIGHKNIPLTLLGSGAGVMSASLARSAGILVGDIVFIPGPGALAVGSVTRIDDDPSAPEVVLQISPFVNLFSVTWVAVRSTGTEFVNTLSSATSTP